MPLNFDQQLVKDFDNMVNVKEFAINCTVTRTTETFGVIKTDVFIGVDDDGMPISKDTPIINLPLVVDIIQTDELTIDSVVFEVFEIQPDGIGGQDVYLKNA